MPRRQFNYSDNSATVYITIVLNWAKKYQVDLNTNRQEKLNNNEHNKNDK